jgi:hypothetical protein
LVRLIVSHFYKWVQGLTIHQDVSVSCTICQDIVNGLEVHVLLLGECESFSSSGDMYTCQMIIDKFDRTSRSDTAG